jgi:GTP 3',8-cyclase
VTDRCNFRCTYCMPVGFVPKAHKDLLTYEEITRLVRLLVPCGVSKLRITGGEPLLRRDLAVLLRDLTRIAGVEDLALTSNGWFLGEHVATLRAAGVHRLNLSLDSLKRDRFKAMTGVDALERVLNSFEQAAQAGFAPLKINCVVVRGVNDDEVVDFADFARRSGHIVRFIEFMPLDSGHAWERSKLVPASEMLQAIERRFRLVPLERHNPSETALRYAFADDTGEIGIIAPVTRPFCGRCNRLRLTADGKLRTCLFSLHEHDLKAVLRSTHDDAAVLEHIRSIVEKKEAGHRINEPDYVQPARTMSCIGG